MKAIANSKIVNKKTIKTSKEPPIKIGILAVDNIVNANPAKIPKSKCPAATFAQSLIPKLKALAV